MSAAAIKELNDRITALEAIIKTFESGKSAKAEKPARSTDVSDFKKWIRVVAMKDEFDEFNAAAKKAAEEAGSKYYAVKTCNDFIKELSTTAMEKLRAEYDEKKEAGELGMDEKVKKPRAKKTDSKKEEISKSGSKSASASGSADASDAEAPVKKMKKTSKSAKTEESASETEAAPAKKTKTVSKKTETKSEETFESAVDSETEKPAAKKAERKPRGGAGSKKAAEESEVSETETAAAPAPAKVEEEKPAEKKIIRRRAKVDTTTSDE
jgi:nucleolin